MEQTIASISFGTQSEAKISNIPHQLHANYIGIYLQFIALRERYNLSGNQP